MKSNIQEVSYETQKPQKDSGWWTWDEICDQCGAVTKEAGLFLSSCVDEQDRDLCLDCLCERLDR